MVIRDEFTDRDDLSYGLKHYYRNRDRKLAEKRQYKHQYPVGYILNGTRSRAKERDVEFNLELEDIIIPEKCPVFGTPLEFTEEGRGDNTPSVDRIDNSRGYVKGNIRIISWRANRLKNNLTKEEVRAILDYMENER